MFDIFISYARLDGSSFAQQLAKSLRAANLRVFLDQDSIPAGANWEGALDEALMHALHILIILTPISVKSEEVAAEWRPMLNKGKNIVPLLYLPCEIPRRLSMRQYIDFQDENTYLKALTELVEVINNYRLGSAQIELNGNDLLQRAQAYFDGGNINLALGDYMSALDSDEPIIRQRALRFIGGIKHNAEILPRVVDLYEAEADFETRILFLEAIRRIVEKQDWQSVLPNLNSRIVAQLYDFDSEIRAEAIRVLASAQIYSEISTIIRVIKNDPDANVRRQGALALGRLKSSESKQALMDILRDTSADTRRAAVSALAHYLDENLIDTLSTIAWTDRDPSVRDAASIAIKHIQDKTEKK